MKEAFDDHDIKVAAVACNDDLLFQEDGRQHVGDGAARKRQSEEVTELEQRVSLKRVEMQKWLVSGLLQQNGLSLAVLTDGQVVVEDDLNGQLVGLWFGFVAELFGDVLCLEEEVA